MTEPFSSCRHFVQRRILQEYAEPTLHFRASCPNERHEFALYVSPGFRLVRKLRGGDWVLRTGHAAARPCQNKPKVEETRLLTATVVDDYSSALWFDYIADRGDEVQTAIKALQSVWTLQGSSKWKLHDSKNQRVPNHPYGVPEVLLTNNDSFARSAEFTTFLDTAGVGHSVAPMDSCRQEGRTHVKSRVERAFREIRKIFETHFSPEELSCAIRAGTGNQPSLKEGEILLSELRREKEKFLAEYNRRPHPLWPIVSRLEAWLRIHPQGGVQAIETIGGRVFRVRERMVNACLEVCVQNELFRIVGAGDHLIGRRVRVLTNPYTEEILVKDPRTGRHYVAEPSDVLNMSECRAL